MDAKPRAVSRSPRLTGRGLVVWLLMACYGPGCSPTPSPETPDHAAAEAAIRAVLQQQVAAWNRGAIDAFMDGYARTDSLRFASGGAVQTGWQATLDRYHRTYPDRAAMGTLTFDLRAVRLLSARWAMVFGSYQLERDEDRPSGLFTLLFEKRPEGWRIVHDHTSAGS